MGKFLGCLLKACGIFLILLVLIAVLSSPDEQETETPANVQVPRQEAKAIEERQKEAPPPAVSVSLTNVVGYTISEQIDRPYKGRNRLLLKIQAPTAETQAEVLETLMKAAVNAQKDTISHIVTVHLYARDKQLSAGSITYSADGCNWPGDKCDAPRWSSITGLLVIPEPLRAYGKVTDEQTAAIEKNACRADLQCWGDKHLLEATRYCKPAVERLAKYAHKWTDGWLEAKFPRFRWGKKGKGIIVYLGDKVQFQNGFGAWVKMSYWCDFNPHTKEARARVFER